MKLPRYVLALLLLPALAHSATLRVPSEYPTIQAGLDAAAFGDTVLVAPGTYTDSETRGQFNVTACAFLVDGVVLRSEQGPEVTAIDMQGLGGEGPNVVIHGLNLPSDDTVLEGFTVTGAPLYARGVLLELTGKVTVRNCILRDMNTGAVVGGLHADGSALDVVDCEFVNCVGTHAGGIWADKSIEVRNSSFQGCATTGVFTQGGGIRLNGEPPGSTWQAVISNCEFIDNSGAGGGAVSIQEYVGGFQIIACHFEGNVDRYTGGGAVACGTQFSAPNTIDDCTFVLNRCDGTGQGGAVQVFGECTLRGNTFLGNSHLNPVSGGQAIVFFEGSGSLENNIIAGSSGTEAVRVDPSSTVTSSCNVFWENVDGNGDGFELGPTDREVDPLFCDAAGEDLTLHAESPCLPENSNGCDLIGALGVGCGTVSIETSSWGRIKGMYRGR